MVVSNQAFDALKSIGLNLYERKLWVALLSQGTSTAGELSVLAKVPRSRCYDILESLADKGFALVQPSKPLKYVALPPEEALERAKKVSEAKHNAMSQRIDSLKQSKVLEELEQIHNKGIEHISPGEVTGTLKGEKAMLQQFETVLKQANSSIALVTSEEALKDIFENHAALLKKAADKGVKIKIAAPSVDATIQEGLSGVAELKATGSPVGRFCVADGKKVILALTNDKAVHPTQDLLIWTQSDHLAKDILGPLFDLYWKQLE